MIRSRKLAPVPTGTAFALGIIVPGRYGKKLVPAWPSGVAGLALTRARDGEGTAWAVVHMSSGETLVVAETWIEASRATGELEMLLVGLPYAWDTDLGGDVIRDTRVRWGVGTIALKYLSAMGEPGC